MVVRGAEIIKQKYREGTATVTLKDSYRNMAEAIRPHWHLIDIASREVEALGGKAVSVPVRGGTDGSRLSFMGLPCPNLGTGGHNGHSRKEYACVQEMDNCVQLLIRIAQAYAEK